jgi:hypothetical protein
MFCFACLWGNETTAWKRNHKNSRFVHLIARTPEEDRMIMNKAMFEEKWKVIRVQSAEWWSLMAEHDLAKVDKAEVKFDKFVTMLQVKYGYTRQKAREELSRIWTEYEVKNKNVAV